MAGRKRLPTNLHVIKGTYREDRANPNEPEPEINIPEPPEHLSGEALIEWNRMSVELERLGLLTEIDRTELAMYCQCWSRVVKYEKIIAEKCEAGEFGELFKTTKGNIMISPAMSVLNRSMDQCHKFLTEFGMTPASRTRVSAKKAKKKNDPWAEFEE